MYHWVTDMLCTGTWAGEAEYAQERRRQVECGLFRSLWHVKKANPTTTRYKRTSAVACKVRIVSNGPVHICEQSRGCKEKRGDIASCFVACESHAANPGPSSSEHLSNEALSGFGRVDAGCWRLIASMASSAPAIEVWGHLSMVHLCCTSCANVDNVHLVALILGCRAALQSVQTFGRKVSTAGRPPSLLCTPMTPCTATLLAACC